MPPQPNTLANQTKNTRIILLTIICICIRGQIHYAIGCDFRRDFNITDGYGKGQLNKLDSLSLADLKVGQDALILKIGGTNAMKSRLASMGVISGNKVAVGHTSPMGDPRAYNILDYMLSLRNEDARNIVVKLRD